MIQTILEGGDIEVKNLKTENYSGNTMEIWEIPTLLSISLKIFLQFKI